MGKTLTKEQRKNSKYIEWDNARKRKNQDYLTDDAPKKEKPKKKWRPHSEVEAD